MILNFTALDILNNLMRGNVKFLFSKLKCKIEAPFLSSQIKIDLNGKGGSVPLNNYDLFFSIPSA